MHEGHNHNDDDDYDDDGDDDEDDDDDDGKGDDVRYRSHLYWTMGTMCVERLGVFPWICVSLAFFRKLRTYQSV